MSFIRTHGLLFGFAIGYSPRILDHESSVLTIALPFTVLEWKFYKPKPRNTYKGEY